MKAKFAREGVENQIEIMRRAIVRQEWYYEEKNCNESKNWCRKMDKLKHPAMVYFHHLSPLTYISGTNKLSRSLSIYI